MKFKELEQIVEEQKLIDEGVFDPSIFKAIWLAGGPGSGKSYVTGKTTGGHSLKMINSDEQLEHLLHKEGLSLDMGSMNPEDYKKAMEIRDKAKKLTKAKERFAKQGRLGMIIDGTGKDFEKIKRQKNDAEGLGYDTYMIFVNTSLDVALERNQMRDRVVPEDIVIQSWKDVQQNMGKFQREFGNKNFIIVDNNDAGEDVFTKVWKEVMKKIKEKPQNPIAKQWIQQELQKRKR